MTLAQRRVLFGAFVVLFCVASVIILLYANGYRYHPQKKYIEKTGELIIDSQPRGSSIQFNGQIIRNNFFGMQFGNQVTPAHLSHLQSGDYRVELLKEGYIPWKSDVSVASGAATVIQNAVLFPKLQPRLLIRQEGIRALGRLDGTHLYFFTDASLFLFDERTKTFSVIYTGKRLDPESFLPSPRGSQIAFRDESGFKVLSIQTGALIGLDDLNQWKSVHWFDEQNLIGIDTSGIKIKRIQSKEYILVYKGKAHDIATQDDIYALVEDSGTTALIRVVADDLRIKKLAQLPKAYRTIRSVQDEMIVVSDAKGSAALYFSNGKTSELLPLSGNEITWQSTDRFAAVNEFELWIYERIGDSFESFLLSRQSARIRNVMHRSPGQYIFFIADNILKSIDVSAQGSLNKYTPSDEIVRSALFSQDTQILYAIGTVNGKEGLVEYEFTVD